MRLEDITSIENLRLVLKDLLQKVPPSAAFTLHGHPGAGKTTLVKTAGAILDVREPVLSPTFNILNIYNGTWFQQFPLRIYHYDFYRLNSADQLHDLSMDENRESIPFYAFLEWPDKVDIKKIMPNIPVYTLTIETEYSPQINDVSRRTLKISF